MIRETMFDSACARSALISIMPGSAIRVRLRAKCSFAGSCSFSTFCPFEPSPNADFEDDVRPVSVPPGVMVNVKRPSCVSFEFSQESFFKISLIFNITRIIGAA